MRPTSGSVWLILLCLQLALVTEAVSFTTVRMPVTYGNTTLPKDYGAEVQREAFIAFATREVPPNFPLLYLMSNRILFPITLATVVRLTGISWAYAFSLLRLTSIFVMYLTFLWFLARLFSTLYAILGILFIAATVTLTFNIPYEVPTDFPEIWFFTLGMFCILERRDLLLCAIIFCATLNRETACFLPLILLFVRWSWPLRIRTAAVASAAGLCWLFPYVVLRRYWMATGVLEREANFQRNFFGHNLPGLRHFFTNFNPFNNYFFYAYLFGVLWILPYAYWRAQPKDMRRVLLTVPIIFSVYFCVGFLNEPREIVLLYPLLVPAGLYALQYALEGNRADETQRNNNQRDLARIHSASMTETSLTSQW